MNAHFNVHNAFRLNRQYMQACLHDFPHGSIAPISSTGTKMLIMSCQDQLE